MEEKFLTVREVSEIVGFKISTIYKFIKTKDFPKPMKIVKSSRWKLTDIKKWLNHQIAKQE